MHAIVNYEGQAMLPKNAEFEDSDASLLCSQQCIVRGVVHPRLCGLDSDVGHLLFAAVLRHLGMPLLEGHEVQARQPAVRKEQD